MILGNIPLTAEKKPINNNYFVNLQKFFHDSALIR